MDSGSGDCELVIGKQEANAVVGVKSAAYVSYLEGILWKANRDGSNPMRLSDPPIYALNPVWSPDGKQILFMDLSRPIRVSSSEGGTPKQIAPGSDGSVEDPNWAPDGHCFVFAADEQKRNPDKLDIRILDLATGHVDVVPGSRGIRSPRWSPDGRLIVATARSISVTASRPLQLQFRWWLPHLMPSQWWYCSIPSSNRLAVALLPISL